MANLDNLNLRGFAIQSISPLDPSAGLVSLARAQTAAPVMTAAAPVVPVETVVQPVQTYPVAMQPVQTYPVATQPVPTYTVVTQPVQAPVTTVLVPVYPVSVRSDVETSTPRKVNSSKPIGPALPGPVGFYLDEHSRYLTPGRSNASAGTNMPRKARVLGVQGRSVLGLVLTHVIST